eukprot:6054930-Alexandrium_andersonii.AAC.1
MKNGGVVSNAQLNVQLKLVEHDDDGKACARDDACKTEPCTVAAHPRRRRNRTVTMVKVKQQRDTQP